MLDFMRRQARASAQRKEFVYIEKTVAKPAPRWQMVFAGLSPPPSTHRWINQYLNYVCIHPGSSDLQFPRIELADI